MRRTKLTSILAAAALATGVAAGNAHADSIVYAKQGNLYLSSADGSNGYQLTFDGGYSSPSQADNGTIGAIRNRQLVRMNRSGQLLNAPIDAMGSDASHFGIAGPYDARLSPDGTRFAYWFYVQTSWSDYYNSVEWISTGTYGAWTYADHFTDPSSEGEFDRGLSQMEWISSDRLLGNQSFWMNIWTWKLGTHAQDSSQYWFGLSDPYDPVWDVTPAHWYDDPALSHDGTKLALTGSAQEGVDTSVYILQTHGPASVGEPPYDNDYLNGVSVVATPDIKCHLDAGGNVVNPSWSRDGNTLAFGAPNGVYAMNVPSSFDCSQMTAHLIAAGGTDPAFGPADVNMAQAPAPPAQPSGPGPNTGPTGSNGSQPSGSTTVTVTKVSVAPKAFRVARRAAKAGGTHVRFTLSAPAKVTLTVATTHGKRVKGSIAVNGRKGANSIAFSGKLAGRTLKPGSYRLTLTVRSATGKPAVASAAFAVKR
jgi:hypothetical protein